ncbi:MAG: ParB N-terminal domain-containing protein [Brasilonema octagenarum HA4186-MV1]|jgi:site-specific DNA-methyltransferase (adenine-specific)|nr:ParB N-terminal domain-containing protein [Brasilonema octagenarum HA4186-MV1]
MKQNTIEACHESVKLADTSNSWGEAKVQIFYLPIENISPHPLNPRPYSEKYQARVDDEKVAELINNIHFNSYDESEPIAVREYNAKYQIIRGHHRWAAMKTLGKEAIPAVVRTMDDKEAAIALVTMQGKEVDSWSRAEHAYECCKAYGQCGLMTVSEYAALVGRKHNTVSELIKAVELKKCVGVPTHLSIRAATDIACLETIDWQWFTKLCLEREWGEKKRTAAIKAVKSIDIPEYLHHWLSPDKWKREAALSSANEEERIPRDVANWVKVAQDCLETLPDSRDIWLFNNEGKPYQQAINLKQQFLGQLPVIKNPSAQRVKAITSKILEDVALVDAEYEEWVRLQKSKEEQQKIQEQKHRKRLAIEAQYSPIGFCGDLREWEIEPESLDAIITDPPYLLSNGGITVRSGKQQSVDKNFDDSPASGIKPEEWLPIAYRTLKPGGYLVVTCTEHLLFDYDLESAGKSCGFHRRQVLIWDKPNAPPNLTADRFAQCFEFIYVAIKPGATPYFGYDDSQNNGKQARSLISIPQCSGNERLGWHDTQKPLALAELLTKAYVPVNGKVADLFAGTGTFTLAAKRLCRISYWVEINPDFFSKTQSRLDQESLPTWLFSGRVEE